MFASSLSCALLASSGFRGPHCLRSGANETESSGSGGSWEEGERKRKLLRAFVLDKTAVSC